MDNLKRPVSFKQIDSTINNFPKQKAPEWDGFTSEFYQIHKKRNYIIHNLFQRTEAEEILSNSFWDSSIMWIPKPDKDIIRKENYRSLTLMNIAAKTLNKTLANQIKCIKRIPH